MILKADRPRGARWPASRPPAARSSTRSSTSPAAAGSTSATPPATCSGCGASDGPRHRHGRPPGPARAGPGADRRRAGVAGDPDADRRPHRHDARTPTAPASPPTRSTSRCASPSSRSTTTRATRTSRRSR